MLSLIIFTSFSYPGDSVSYHLYFDCRIFFGLQNITPSKEFDLSYPSLQSFQSVVPLALCRLSGVIHFVLVSHWVRARQDPTVRLRQRLLGALYHSLCLTSVDAAFQQVAICVYLTYHSLQKQEAEICLLGLVLLTAVHSGSTDIHAGSGVHDGF
jgi:hypothetical protein